VNAQANAYRLPGNDDIAGLGTDPIPAGPYYQPAYFELEREAVFKRTWLQIGHSCELPEAGCFIVRELDVARASILIVRGRDDQLRAFHNVCTHRGTQLVAEQCGKRAAFTCRYHAWTFGHDGQLRGAPDFERFYVDKARCGLAQVAVDVCGGLIFVNLEKSPVQGLREFLGPLAEQLDATVIAKATDFSEYIYEIDANWKLTYDNFQENYHLRFIHPRSGEGAAGPDNPFGYPLQYGFHGVHRTETIWSNPETRPKPTQGFAFGIQARAAAAEGFMNSPQGKQYFALFPNFFMFCSAIQPFSHVVIPIGPERSRGVIRVYWIGADQSASQRFAREYAMVSARDIHAEDRAVIEAGQRGLSSGALEHIHYQSQEVLCRHLFHSVDNMVQAWKAKRRSAGAGA
jgi:phenylpropionate dioxygenase-like ring-hydroxylating dioxygenase large terminal subunit